LGCLALTKRTRSSISRGASKRDGFFRRRHEADSRRYAATILLPDRMALVQFVRHAQLFWRLHPGPHVLWLSDSYARLSYQSLRLQPVQSARPNEPQVDPAFESKAADRPLFECQLIQPLLIRTRFRRSARNDARIVQISCGSATIRRAFPFAGHLPIRIVQANRTAIIGPTCSRIALHLRPFIRSSGVSSLNENGHLHLL